MQILKKVIQNRTVQHLLFWVLSFYVLLRIFAYEFPPQKVDYVYTLLFHGSLGLGVYLNLMILIPRLLRKGYYLAYFGAFTGTLLMMILVNSWTFRYVSDLLFPGYYFISYYQFADLLQFSLVYLVVSGLIKLSKGWFQLSEKDKQIQELEKQKLQAELQALKHQLDPHFLFNSLNTIYSMTLEDTPGAGEAILQLSDNMRYVLYQADAPAIDLASELTFIQNYLALQKARLGDNNVDIQLHLHPNVDTSIQIAPLLFLPFIENAFKHGLRKSHEAPFVHIYFRQKNKRLLFELHNSMGKKGGAGHKAGGIGLPNARKRLAALYPGQHELKVLSKEKQFSVYLSITPGGIIPPPA